MTILFSGSTVDREASEKEREKELPTLKDNDFVNEQMKVCNPFTKSKLIYQTNLTVWY